MGKPLKFIYNSDYATLKNDSDTETLTVNIPGGVAIPLNGVIYTADKTIGTAGAPLDVQINYSASSRVFNTVLLNTYELNSSNNTNFTVSVLVYKLNGSTVRLRVEVRRGFGGTNTTVARTVTATVRTYIPPV
jgi:hypothetical protein